MPIKIPLREFLTRGDGRTVDVPYMLDFISNHVGDEGTIRNGTHLWARRNLDGTIVISPTFAKELAKLTLTYRYFWRAYQLLYNRGLDVSDVERLHILAEAREACLATEKVEKEKE